jgi:hypothetical protein
VGIVPELGRQLGSSGDQPRLAELGLASQQQAVLKLDIGQGQVQRFADAAPRTAEHEEEGPKRRGLQGAQRRGPLLGGGYQLAEFFSGVTIGGLRWRAGGPDRG